MEDSEEVRNDSIRTTLQTLIADSEALLAELGQEGTRRYRQAAKSLDRQIQRAREDLDDLHYSAMRRAKVSIRRADAYVHENPWRTTAGAAATGILIGALLAFLMTRK